MNQKLNRYEVVGLVVLLISIISFSLGVYYPLLSVKYSLFGVGFGKTNTNIFDSVLMFFNSGDYFIAAIIFVFTFLLPIYKYAELLVKRLILGKEIKSTSIDKWNMLDVFLVALLLLNFKMNSAIIVMDLEIGTMFIAIAVVTRMFSIILLSKNK